jgi:cell division septum initiation protein DivIVA
MDAQQQPVATAEALGRIEEMILPGLSAVLDSLIDAASLARPGDDAERYASELRSIATQLHRLQQEVEAVLPQSCVEQARQRANAA